MKKSSSNTYIDKLAEPKRPLSQRSSASMTLAEQVFNFHAKTPKRFRTKGSPIKKANALNLGVTIGQSPNLKTGQRIRPSTAISREEQEILMLEEAKK